MSEPAEKPLILLTGATGYVGGRLLEALQQSEHRVRCLARRPEYLENRVGESTSVVRGDVLDPATLPTALEGVDTAFYLVHSIGATRDFESRDRQAALNFAAAAQRAGVRRIIYLGGLDEAGEGRSNHLHSRQKTGALLRSTGVPVIEFRASIILGSGSLSFEMIRTLVERLPVMICPRWVEVLAQPIYIADVISYLTESLELPDQGSRVFEIGGADTVSFLEIMREYARQRGLRRFVLPVPVLTPNLSSLWLGLTTPVYARVGRKLIASIANATIVRVDEAERTFDVQPVSMREAIRRSIENEDRGSTPTRWFDAVSSAGPARSWGGTKFGRRLVDARRGHVAVGPDLAFAPIRRIGGTPGWYYANWLWGIRGFIDLMLGGVGVRRGRSDPEELAVGAVIGFWRVEEYEPGRRLRLAAEMKVPGRAWLEFEVEPDGEGGTMINQTAIYDPVGLLGLAYWYGIYPLHVRVFRGMLAGIVEAVGVAATQQRRVDENAQQGVNGRDAEASGGVAEAEAS